MSTKPKASSSRNSKSRRQVVKTAPAEAPAVAPTNGAQMKADELAAGAAAALARWDVAAISDAIRLIEAGGVAPSRVLLLANLLRSHGFNEFCARLLRLQFEGKPPTVSEALSSAVNRLRATYPSESALREARAAYASGMQRALTLARSEPKASLAAFFPDVLTAMPFYLAYQGADDRELQTAYGEIVSRIVAAAVPAPAYKPPAPPAKRIRLIFATAFGHTHSVMKMCISWIENIDRERFETIFLHLGKGADALTERVEAAVDRFERGPRTAEEWGSVIEAHQPHAILYLEIGMDALTISLAAQRLAPVQCTTWGHPQTSGLRTIDYFLTSDLMEPEDADRFYTEKLVRLPNLSVSYQPLKTRAEALGRDKLGARDGETLYLCCQSLFKYLPRYDHVFARIAVQVPNSRFIFIGRPQDPATRSLDLRLRNVFSEHGLDASRYVVFCEPLPFSQFSGFLRMGDVFLDSIGWSGANTTLEAIDVDLPIVTFPVGLMRGRHTSAILTLMDLREGVAGSMEDYIAKAAALADPLRREAFQTAIRAKKGKLFGDESPIRALESFLAEAVDRAHGSSDVAAQAVS